MVNTRRTSESSQHDAGNNPPPPPQTLAEVVAQQTQILQLLAQNQVNQQQQPHGRQVQSQVATYSNFAITHPPTFTKADDPLEADSWLRLMESKFELLVCTEEQKTLFAAHQLRGLVASWWATYLAMQPTGRRVPWTEFRAAFRAYHILSSVLKSSFKNSWPSGKETRWSESTCKHLTILPDMPPTTWIRMPRRESVSWKE